MVEEPDRRDADAKDLGVMAYMGHGLTWAASTLLFLWVGNEADRWLGTEPWLALLGAFMGAVAGFYHMYHHLIVVPRGPDEERDE